MAHPDLKLTTNPLSAVLTQVVYTTSPALHENINQIQAELKKIGFYIREDRQILAFSLNPQMSPARPTTTYMFYTPKRDQCISIGEEVLSFYTRNYKSLNDFNDILFRIVEIIQIYNDNIVVRLGLRYINLLDIEGDCFRSHMIFKMENNYNSSGYVENYIRYVFLTDRYQVRLISEDLAPGQLLPPDVAIDTIYNPSKFKQEKPYRTLDIDCIFIPKDSVEAGFIRFDKNEICNEIKSMNLLILDVFTDSVKAEFIEERSM